MVFHWSLSDSKSQVSGNLLSILVNLTNVVVWMILACSLISNASKPLTKPLGIIPSVSITTGITIVFIFTKIF